MAARLSDYIGRDGKIRKAEGKPTEYKQESKGKYLKESSLLKEESTKEERKTKVELLTESMQEARVDKETSLKIYEEAMLLVKDAFQRAERQEPIRKENFAEVIKDVIDRLISDGQALLSLINKESKENYLYAHSVNVCILAVKVGIGLGYNKPQLADLGIAALLHDIGMVKIPKEIIAKPGELKVEEYSEVKKHPTYGAEILSRSSDINKAIVDSVYHQHERIDGRGYPQGLKDEEINEYAKIIGLVDVYEALTHSRAYRKKKYRPDEAMRMIADLDGNSFKPYIAKVLRALIKEISPFPIGNIVELNTGEIGRVIRINKDFLSRPVVNIGIDSNGNRLTKVKVVNLAEEPLLYIKRLLDSSEIDIELPEDP